VATHRISMEDFQFNPKTIDVAVGDSIVWFNAGSVSHSAARDDAPTFDTGLISPGNQSTPVTLMVSGSMAYFCRPHMGHMKGTIIVT
jgi:plastocyanin